MPNAAPLGGIWSAIPTPFRDDLPVDAESVRRLVECHARLGVVGLLPAGTCGDVPWIAAQARMTELMHRVYGGPAIECWLAGLKYLLVQIGVFATGAGHLGYPLTAACRAAIDEAATGGFAEEIGVVAT